MDNRYTVFTRTPWRKVNGAYVPNPGARRHVTHRRVTLQRARELCAQGAANIALREGREYRHLSFCEFTEGDM